MWLHVVVRAAKDEPLTTTHETAAAGLAWLLERRDRGIFRHLYPFDQTGGCVDVWVDAEDVGTARDLLDEMWFDYPLLPTITYTADKMLDSIEEGFDKLFAAIAERRPIEVSP